MDDFLKKLLNMKRPEDEAYEATGEYLDDLAQEEYASARFRQPWNTVARQEYQAHERYTDMLDGRQYFGQKFLVDAKSGIDGMIAKMGKDDEMGRFFQEGVAQSWKNFSLQVQMLAAEDPRRLNWFLAPYFVKREQVQLLISVLGDMPQEVSPRLRPTQDLDAFVAHTKSGAEQGGTPIAKKLAQKPIDWRSSPEKTRCIQGIITAHVERMERQRGRIEAAFHAYKERFVQALMPLMREGRLPLSPSQLRERVENILIRVVDPLVEVTQDLYGSYDEATHTIKLSAELGSHTFEATAAHELFHAISGQSRVGRGERYEPRSFTEPLRAGLGFIGRHGVMEHEEGEAVRFRWLNEGVTEYLTKILHPSAAGEYSHEVHLVETLLEFGIVSEKKMLAAFFEEDAVDAQGHADERGPNPAVRAFFQESNKNAYPGFFMEIDRGYREAAAKGHQSRYLEEVTHLIRRYGARGVRNATKFLDALK